MNKFMVNSWPFMFKKMFELSLIQYRDSIVYSLSSFYKSLRLPS